MKKKIGIIILLIALIISLVFLGIVIKNNNDLNNEILEGVVGPLTSSKIFYAEIKETYDNKILVDGLDINDINFQGEFEVPILESTTIKSNDETIELTELKVGDKISIVFNGEILEKYPAVVKNVREIKLFSEQQYQDLVSELTEKSRLINEFYTEDITKNYKKITELGEDYTVEDAKLDNCYTQIHFETFNKEIYTDFMQKYNNKESAFLRLASCTIEGDTIIYDVKYDSVTNKVTVIRDLTRERYMNYEETIITINEYEKIGEYTRQGLKLLVAYNGEISEDKFNTEDVMTIMLLN